MTFWLSYPDSDAYPFPFKIGERLRSISKDIDGIVHNAIYNGPDNPKDGDYYILYHIVTDEGEYLKIPLHDLEKVTMH